MAVPTTKTLDSWCRQHIKGYRRYETAQSHVIVYMVDSGVPDQEMEFSPVHIDDNTTAKFESYARRAGLWLDGMGSPDPTSEDGITIGLIHSILTAVRALKGRKTGAPDVRDAIIELARDPVLKRFIHYAKALAEERDLDEWAASPPADST